MNVNVEEMNMQNLAKSNPSPNDIDEVTAVCRAELEAAGIKSVEMDLFARDREVPSRAIGELETWGFRRAWYYWVAEGPGIPPDIAEELHAQHGKDVRVDGHCACPSPREWFKGFAVGRYHVDTQEGLNALAATIRKIAVPRKETNMESDSLLRELLANLKSARTRLKGNDQRAALEIIRNCIKLIEAKPKSQ